MNKLLLAPALLVLLPLAARAQVGIGTTSPNTRAALEISATDKGLLIPRLTAAQRTALTSVPQGLLVYQTDGTASGGAQTGFWYYGGSGGWVFLDASAGSGLTLPFSGSFGGSSGTAAFDVSHTNGGVALRGAAPNTGIGVQGSSSTGSGVYGTASGSGGYGVRGNTTATSSAGVYGNASGTNTYGVIGSGETGVLGQGGSGPGLSGTSNTAPALLAAKSSGQTGRVAELTLTGTGNDSTAVYVSTVGARPALRAVNSNASRQAAIRGVKTAGVEGSGVEGVVTSGGGITAGVLGNDKTDTSIGSGVIGLTAGGYGVRGIASASGGYGVAGTATNSYGVIGGSQSGVGVYGSSQSNYGVQGVSENSSAVIGLTTSGFGVRSQANGAGRAGYFAQINATSTANVVEMQNSGLGRTLYVNQGNSSNTADAARLDNAGTGRTLYLTGNGQTLYVVTNAASPSTSPFTAVGTSSSAVAGTFIGNVNVSGSLSKGGGSFKIDHPLDPENQYLYHSFVESPDMLNVYNGNVTLDAKGEAVVQLPDYFEALNRDFRYQLTPIGAAFTPYVLSEVQDNRFRVAGQPGAKVSWQVTGIRQDQWANQHRIPTAQPKEPENRGKYLHPADYGQPASRGIGYQAETAAQPARRPESVAAPAKLK